MPDKKKSLKDRLIGKFVEKKEAPHYAYIRAGRLALHETSDPILMRGVMKDHEGFQGIGFLRKTLSKLIGKALIIEEGETWSDLHSVLSKCFTPKRIGEGMAPLVIEECDSMIDRWEKDGGTEDVEKDMIYMTGRVITRALFSDTVSEEDGQEILDISAKAIALVAEEGPVGRAMKKQNIPYDNPGFLPSIAARAMGIAKNMPGVLPPGIKKAAKEVDEIIYRIIDERRALEEQPDDMMGQILSGRYPDGSPLSDKDVRDQLVMMVVAGHETTAGALTFTMWEVLKHEEAPKRIRDEFNEVIGTEPMKGRDYMRLTYAQSSLKEGMRLHPPLRTATREVHADKTVEGINFKKDDIVKMDVEGVQTHPDFWDNPKEFSPERFQKDRQPRAYFPFGAGRRICMGINVALMEGTVVLSRVFNKLDIEMTQEPTGVQHFFTKRPIGKLKLAAKKPPAA